ncbi:protein yellow-like [Copidosoma floridanum]|uniref:protein yellow-like n=1 Tax=Copidosoma floridanum TaxID=29053 RepID=UPI0006C9D613|nr:protein yellow-like [Copidosoma floridanum]
MIKHLALALALWASLGSAHEPFIVQFQWNYVNYTWPTEELYLRAAKDESYLEKSNVISGIKLWKGKMYLTIPRWRNGVPVTLAVTPAVPVNGTTAPQLEPYPDWDAQKIGGDCSGLQSVQNVEIDPMGRMWVLDTGRVATMTTEAAAAAKEPKCPPRLVILDLEDGGKVLRSYGFPANVARPEGALLNDIVLDHEDGGLAYISDSDQEYPGIIVFSLQNLTSWKLSHDSMRVKEDEVGFIVEQTRVKQRFNIGGLALSPAYTEGGNRVLYYTPLSSLYVFALPTHVLKYVESGNLSQEVKVLGRKPSQTAGMAMSSSGILYFGLLADDAVSMWDSKNPSFMTGQRIISRDHHLMQWPNSLAFDDRGRLWCITNRLHKFLDNSLSIDEPNFRAIMSKTRMQNYQYYDNGTAPELPFIAAGAGRALGGTALAALLVLLMLVQ